MTGTNTIEEILEDIHQGKMVIMMDDEDRENEGDLIMAAEKVTPEAVAFIVRHTSGIICMPMLAERLQELHLPQMVPDNTDTHRTAFTISVDYRHGTTTGISAQDRTHTIRALADLKSRSQDFARPGHIFPLRYAEGGVLCRAGHTEAAVDLAVLAGLNMPAGIVCEIVNDDGSVKRGPQLAQFAVENNLKIGTIADLIRYRMEKEKTVERLSSQKIQTEFGEFEAFSFNDRIENTVHFALVAGKISENSPTLVRVHVQSTLSDVLGINWETLGWPLRDAMRRIAKEGGVLILLRVKETTEELTQLFDTQGESRTPSDAEDKRENGVTVLRTYGVGAQILTDLGVCKMRVLSAPMRMHGISGFGLEVVEYVE
ncbi:MAG: 3,4-dihydroxy-2-butanone-4-phosphate synthase [Gammaproteobacteria bacterium]